MDNLERWISFLMIGVIIAKADACIDNGRRCTFRYELKFDFAHTFDVNCTKVYGSCICLNHTNIQFFVFPPYVVYDHRVGRPFGILPSKFSSSRLFQSLNQLS